LRSASNDKALVVDFQRAYKVRFQDHKPRASRRATERERFLVKGPTVVTIKTAICGIRPEV
jgi:hypothetical protein